ncbi:hypothetical protein [Pyxidicoccus xibeiensis]|uniref:hypothetical protein n=1 Tax=Pyxidicoccus xibeiensis TaxID=2906759 RepID=UPI0020A81138|nr:hypothetical protein [Pyxidicoccus xibeiensis]MCP3142920.1 hypothetical protein [Pyxidicoccus xibeiensis]
MSKDSGKTPSPNDQRSNTKNPNNPAQKSAQENRSNQMNPNNPRHSTNTPGGGSSGGTSGGGFTPGSGSTNKS